jgi:hypothetical protein
MDVIEHGARGIGGVGHMGSTTGQLPDQKAIHRAKQQFPPPRFVARALDMVQNPFQLGAREIGIGQQAGPFDDNLIIARFAQAAAKIGGATVLPDNRIVDRLPGRSVPNQCGFALIGDADCDDVIWPKARLFNRCTACARGGRPQIGRVMLDPAGIGEMLRELFLRCGDDPHRTVKNDRPA